LLSARIAVEGSGMAAGGQLALSGILENQADEVIAAYAPFAQLRVAAVLDGWVLLDGSRGRRAE